MFVLDKYAPRVTLEEQSASAERIEAVAHSDCSQYLICSWYRPPHPGNLEPIASFETEYNKNKSGAVGAIILGDLNVHSARWFRHSARESIEGRTLWEMSCKLGLQ